MDMIFDTINLKRPEQELPDSPGAQVQLLHVINLGKAKCQSDAQDIAPRLSMATASPVAAGVRLAGFCHAVSLGTPCSTCSSTSQCYRS